MKAKFLIAAAALVVVSASPAFANTPSADPFGAFPNDQMARPAPDHTGNGDAFVSPFDDHMRQSQTDDMHPLSGSHDNLIPPRMDSSGVPDPRI